MNMVFVKNCFKILIGLLFSHPKLYADSDHKQYDIETSYFIEQGFINIDLKINHIANYTTANNWAVMIHYSKDGTINNGVRQFHVECEINHASFPVECKSKVPILGSLGDYNARLSIVRETVSEYPIRELVFFEYPSKFDIKISQNSNADILPPRLIDLWVKKQRTDEISKVINLQSDSGRFLAVLQLEDDLLTPMDNLGKIKIGKMDYSSFTESFSYINHDYERWSTTDSTYYLGNNLFEREIFYQNFQQGNYKLNSLYQVCDVSDNCAIFQSNNYHSIELEVSY